MLTSYPDEEAVLSAIVAGASGYLLKQIRARDLVAALEAVGRGESLLDPAVTEKVLERDPPDRDRRRTRTSWPRSPPQEQKILLLVAEGKTNKEIAAEVFLSDKTVKNYVSLDPLEAQPRAARPGGGVRREAPAGPRRRVASGPRPAVPRMEDDLVAWGRVAPDRDDRPPVTGRVRPVHRGLRRAEPGGAIVVAAGSRDAAWGLNLLADPRCRCTLEDGPGTRSRGRSTAPSTPRPSAT